jgi:Family of unknown function (DUF5760)
MEKEELISIVKEWVKNDAEIRTLQKEQMKRKQENKQLSLKLMEIMKTNEIDCFDMKDGKLMYKKRNVRKPLTKTILLKVLSTYFNEDQEKAISLNNYILENREVTVKESIQFKEGGQCII